MKTRLLYILVFSVIGFAGCKKEESNTDPFTNGTEFDYVQNNTVVVKNDSIIVSVHSVANNSPTEENRTIDYFGDSIAVITVDNWYPQNNTHTITIYTYYLNEYGLADSSIISNTSGNTPPMYYEYNSDGYLHATGYNRNSIDDLIYEYSNGNSLHSNGQYEYYPTVAKLDIFSTGRKFDNRITGKDDKNLPKRIRIGNSDDFYYYQFDIRRYVTSVIIVDDSDGLTFLRFNFTYQFVQ